MKIIKVYRMVKKSTSTTPTIKTNSKKNKVKHNSHIENIYKQLHRDEDYIEEYEIPRESRIMRDLLTDEEYARALLERTSQIEYGSAHFLTEEEVKNCTSSKEIAKLEIVLRKSPLIIKRYTSNAMFMYELWAVNELILPHNI